MNQEISVPALENAQEMFFAADTLEARSFASLGDALNAEADHTPHAHPYVPESVPFLYEAGGRTRDVSGLPLDPWERGVYDTKVAWANYLVTVDVTDERTPRERLAR